MSDLSQPRFHCEEAAFAWLEAIRWPQGPVCPHCGNARRIRPIKPNPEKRIRLGLKTCGACRKQFTVKVGTVFEHARIPLHKMLRAAHLMSASEAGISARQLHRTLEVQYRSAWFLARRIRAAMRDGALVPVAGVGGMPGASGAEAGGDARVGRVARVPAKAVRGRPPIDVEANGACGRSAPDVMA